MLNIRRITKFLRLFLIISLILLQGCCAPNSPLLLYSTSRDIRTANTLRPTKTTTIVTGLEQGHAIDFYHKGKLVCWGDHGPEVIECASYNSTNNTMGDKFVIPSEDYITPNGIAIDWVTEKIYWTDGESNRIEVASLKNKMRKVLFWNDLDLVRAIAVVPEKGLLFWTDWGDFPKIERAGMNGDPSTRKILVKDNIVWPNGLTVDYDKNVIYWLDADKRFIDVMDFDGKNRSRLVKGLVYPFALTYFDEKLYWTDWNKWSLYSWDISTKGPIKDIFKSEPAPIDIKVFDERRQPEPKSVSSCQINNGDCSHLCLLSPTFPGHSCVCPTGIKMKSNSTTQCWDRSQNVLIVAQRNAITKISLDSPDFTPKQINGLRGIKRAMAVDYDIRKEYIYWADSIAKSISRVHLDGSEPETIIHSPPITPESIAIDVAAQNIYWTDPQTDTITVAKLDGSYRKVLIYEDLYAPRAIALHSNAGWMFWSDWYEKKPKIERASLDGSNRILLVSERLAWPNGIALDIKHNKIYWGDGKTHKIEVCDMDGNNRREVYSDNKVHIFGLSLLGNHIYWTDIQTRSLERVDKDTGAERQVIVDQMTNIFGLKAINLEESSEQNICSADNNGCSHFCFNRPSDTVCGCPLGLELSHDQKSCIEPNSFLIYGRKNEIGRIGIENQNNNAVLPIKELKDVSALAVHTSNSKIYWSDGKAKAIFRCAINGSNVEKILDWTGIVEGLAIDWAGQNIYFTDTALQRIEVARLDGSSRKALVWQGLKKPKSIVLDPKRGYMYWAEMGSKCIKRAGMDGSSPSVLIEQAGRVTSLSVDGSRLCWASLEPPGIECSDLEGRSRRRITTAPPSAMTMLPNNILWADWTKGTIESVNKTTGQQNLVYATGFEYITSLKAFERSSQTSSNQCSADNGGCERLCLANPNGYVCGCPTHYKLKNDNLGCEEPQEYLLYFQKNSMGRIMLTTNDCPDTILPLPGIKNIKSIDYDPIERLVYWVEGDAGVVRRAPLEAKSIPLDIDQDDEALDVIQSGDELSSARDVSQLAIDTIGRALYWTTQDVGGPGLQAVSLLPPRAPPANLTARALHIAMHATRRLLVWIEAGDNSLIRASVDGSGRRHLTNATNVTSLTIDVDKDIIYWATSRQIRAIDLDGSNERIIWHGGPAWSLSVTASTLYWIGADRMLQRLSSTSNSHLPRANAILAVHAVDRSHPCYGGGACGVAVGACLAEGTCGCGAACRPAPCPPGHLPCASSPRSQVLHTERCIPAAWRCDLQADCADGSDELDCGACAQGVRCAGGGCADTLAECSVGAVCAPGQFPSAFRCGRVCLDTQLVCDGRRQCDDGSDEIDCVPTADHANRAPALLAAGLCAALVLGIWGVWVARGRIKQSRNSRACIPPTRPRPRPVGASRTPRDPPPSPASARRRPYRHYRAMNRPPPPTPCSTSACESDYWRKSGRTPAPPPPPSPASTYRAPAPPPSPAILLIEH